MPKNSPRNYLYVALFLLVVLAVPALLALLPQPAVVTLPPQVGVVDLSAADFDDTVYYYKDNTWQHWPAALLTPQQLEAPGAPLPGEMGYDDFRTVQYATHRVQLRLPPGQVYALSMRSADYAMRLYVDGEELGAVGRPGATAESNTPGVAQVTYYFMPTGDVTTIVVLSSNWVHREGAFAPNFTIGTAANIDALNRHTQLITFLLTGSLLTGFLYHLGLFLLNRRRFATLVFALGCLLMAILCGNFTALFPLGISWYAAIRLEYIVHFLTFGVMVLFLQLLYPRLLHRYATRAFYALVGLYVLSTFVFPPKTYTLLIIGFEAAAALMAVYVLVRLAMQLRRPSPAKVLTFAGMGFVALCGIYDILFRVNVVFTPPPVGQLFTTPVAMVFLMFCYALVVALDYAETEHRAEEAQRKVAEAEARVLELLAQSETPAHAQPADFGLSARETDVLWLLLDGKTRPEITESLDISPGTVNTYCSRIYKKTNVKGLAELYKLFGVALPAEKT